MTARFQAAQIHGVIAAAPAVKRLPGDPEATTGESHILGPPFSDEPIEAASRALLAS